MLDEAVRIIRRRDAGDPDRKAGAEQALEGADARIAAGLVAVEAQHHLVHIALEDARMVRRERGALRGDHVADAGAVAGDGVELAFAHDRVAGVEDGPLRLVEGEEHLALGEDGRLGRVHILRHLLVALQDAAAEGDHAALLVADGKHQPAAEAVVEPARVLLPDDEPGLLAEGCVIALRLGPVHRVVPGLGSGPEAEFPDGFHAHTALVQVVAGDLAGGLVHEALLPALGDGLVELEQRILHAARLLGPRIVLRLEGDARALGEPGEGLDKGEVLVVLHEAEHVPALVAAEAVEDLLARVHVEAGRLLLMEGAERDEVRAGALERQVAADDIDYVTRGANLFAEVVGKKRHARRMNHGWHGWHG